MALEAANLANPFKNSQALEALPPPPNPRMNSVTCKPDATLLLHPHQPFSEEPILSGPERRQHPPLTLHQTLALSPAAHNSLWQHPPRTSQRKSQGFISAFLMCFLAFGCCNGPASLGAQASVRGAIGGLLWAPELRGLGAHGSVRPSQQGGNSEDGGRHMSCGWVAEPSMSPLLPSC